jgi:hypothetical protein
MEFRLKLILRPSTTSVPPDRRPVGRKLRSRVVADSQTFDARKNSTSCRWRGNFTIAETMFLMINNELLHREEQ